MAKHLNRTKPETILVIGLGRFGSSVATSLIRMGHEVLGVDQDAAAVQDAAGRLTHAVQASILTALAVIEAGVPTIWAKATNDRHGKILKSIGVKNVVYPEARMGQMVAHILTGKMMDFVDLDNDFAMIKTRAPAELIGMSLEQAKVRQKFGVTVVGIKRQGEVFTYAQANTIVQREDLLIVLGETELVERFASRT